jgi:hypothetical protein
MKISSFKERIQEVIDDVLCNKCGKTQLYAKEDFNYEVYGVQCYFTGGFYSKAFPDMSEWEFSLCEECLFELFKTFKYQPDNNLED